ncbi:MAG: hypothetical protein ISR65_18045 [Bacteriovoracaceae bacterium]|nr:hypothetical protein [Bacteriovoracaceae bacterium]
MNRYFINILLFLAISLSARSLAKNANSNADGDIPNILNHIAQHGFTAPTKHTLPQQQKLTTLPKSMSFLNFYQDQSLFIAPLSKDEVKQAAYEIVNKDFEDLYQQASEETQILCMTAEDELIIQKCDDVLEMFSVINDQINLILDQASLEPGEGLANLVGINQNAFNGENVTYNLASSSDPHHDLHQESDSTPSRNSVLTKGHIHPTKTAANDHSSLDLDLCNVQKWKTIPLPIELLKRSVSKLEEALIDDKVSLANKKKIYCTLDTYYNQNDLTDKLIYFLYLNMPPGENFCQD